MKKSKKLTMSLISLVLIVTMMFSLTTPAFAQTNTTEVIDNSSSYTATSDEAEQGNIIGEDVSKRDEYTKHFVTDAGTTIAAQYAFPVHYKNADGEYVDYDNRLIESEVESSAATVDEATVDEISAFSLRAVSETPQTEEVLTNKESDSKVAHFKKSGKAKLVEITRDGHTISWGYSGANIVDAQKVESASEKLTGNDAFLSLPNLSSTVLYEDIYNNIDLEVINSTAGVKENIILKAENAKNVFNIEYSIGDLTAESKDAHTVVLKDAKGQEKYTITAPFMQDANGEQSEALVLKILKNNKGKLSLKLTADKTWLKDSSRAYPVTIDPTFEYGENVSDVTSTYVNSALPTDVMAQHTNCRVSREGTNRCYGLFKVNQLPILNSGDYIINSELNVYPREYSESDIQLRAYKITSAWTHDTVTYANTRFDTTVIDYADVPASSSDVISFDITKVAKEWYSGDANNGILLGTNDSAYIYLGGYHCYYLDRKPIFTVTYKNYVGTEPNLTYHTYATNIYGTGYVSDAMGTMVLRQNLVEGTGARLPVSITMTYNSLLSHINSENGMGWHMSFNRHMDIPSEKLQSLGYAYVYTDEDGTEHYFTKYEATDDEITPEDVVESWVDEDDLGYVITKSGDDLILDAGNGVEQKFSNPANSGKLISETDEYNNTISYEYTDGYLTKITDGAGRAYSIAYVENVSGQTKVSRITAPDGSYVSFAYGTTAFESEYLTTISYSNRETVNFTYEDLTHKMVSTNSTCGTNIVYTYNSDGTVSRITDSVSENYLQFTYNNDRTTRVEDKQGRSEIYTFDSFGNTISVVNADGHLENTGNSDGNLYLSTSSDSYTKNYIEDPYMVTREGYYYVSYGDDDSKVTFSTSTNEVDGERTQYFGTSSVRVKNTSTTHGAWGMKNIETTELSGKDITFSSYVKTSNIVLHENPTAIAGVVLRMEFFDSADTVLSKEFSFALIGSNKWQRLSVSGYVPEDTTKIKLYFGMQGATGMAWFDGLQCEESTCMNDFNFLPDSDFSTEDTWSDGSVLIGDATLAQSTSQTLPINRKNLSFNMTGTAQAESVPLKDDRTFGIKLKVNYEDGTSEEHLQSFNPATSAKQSVSMFVTPEKSDVIITDVEFSFVYDYNMGTMTIYDAMLNFEYNMYEVVEEEETTESTEEIEETLSTEPYDGYAYIYDTYGNNTITYQGTVIPSEDGEDTIDLSKTHISTRTLYDSTGNYVVNETDSRGNTVYYSVDPNNGRVNSITDAKGNVTSYTYDAYGNVLSETSGNVTNTFTYADTGNLTAITHNGFSYSFGYDSYGNNTTTSIGSRTLITNTYGTDNFSLTRSTFGNGDVINYTYDDMGRVVEISNDENTLAKYVYNKKGAIAKVIDVASGINTEYWYNLSGVVLSTISYNSGREVVYSSYDTTDTDGNSITVSAIGDATRVVTSGVDENDNSFVDNDGWRNTLTMDSFGRVVNKATVPSSGSAFTSTYTYLEGSTDNSTTEFIEDIAVKFGDADVITYTYEYDANGNITREYQDGVSKYYYTYDSLNQLVAVNNYVDNTYTTYAYDNGGNIIRETVQNTHPTGGYPIGVQSDITYTYGDSEWKDLLTEYNGQTITYDQVGNPLTYRDGISFTWQNGRELATLTKDGNTISYTYDSNGIRTEKNNGGTVTKYFYDESNNLISLIQGDTQLVFYYDADGQADSFVVYSGEETARYYYVKNLQGDVTKIMSADGNIVANYYYDAYGKLLSTTNAEGTELTDTTSVAFLNPLRYRGYVYDSDTGLYYLQSRYYDPDVCRFINADMFVYTTGIIGSNMYVYCENNPVMKTDNSGNIAANVIGAVIGTVIGIVGGIFLGNWLADILKLSGWKRTAFVCGVSVLVGAAAGVIGYFIGPYVAKIAVKFGKYVLDLLKKGKIVFKNLSKSNKTSIRSVCKLACFVEGTKILTEEGLVPIEQVALGDKVWSENPYTDEAGYKRVVETFVNQTDTIVKLNYAQNEIICTANHPFWVVGDGWEYAAMLQPGDVVKCADDTFASIKCVEIIHLDTPVNVYNFEVEDWHTYFVGETSILVHNMCAKEFVKSPKNAKQVLKYLKEQGFRVVSQNGSHVKLTDGLKTTIVPDHGKKDIAIGTLKSIMKQAGLL